MANIIGVRFKKPGKIYFFDPNGIQVQRGQFVIVETSMGKEYGEVVVSNRMMPDEKIVAPLKKIIRIANHKDAEQHKANKEKEKEAFNICEKKIQEHKLDMKLTDVEYKFDRSKLLFFFKAEGRIDFRELVKELAAIFKTRIELRQMGVRDEIRRTGGNGMCGRELCCCSFLSNFESVSIKMAKEQNLPLNPTKISGNCGRLMCCLKYEQEVYEEKLQRLPKIGAIVKTEDGKGEVCGVETLKEKVKVKLEDGEGYLFKKYDIKDIKIIKNVETNNEKIETDNPEDLKELQKLEKLDKMEKQDDM
ncbi:MAG: stage 0 sporulation family protein [Oscillospiraceae bacterium]|nr:stage 0 sporulation family protein [Oscillospiraceae bacterium]